MNTEPQDQAPDKSLVILDSKNPTSVVLKMVTDLQESRKLHLPADYSAENAIKSAWLALEQNDGARGCTPASIVQAVFDMVVQGLNPMKKQCYFIAYGKVLQCQRSYFGDQALAIRLNPGIEFYEGVVYEGDEFAIDMARGRKYVAKHVTQLENQDKPIKGAYCGYVNKDGEDMGAVIKTMAEIDKSWSQSKSRNANSPHAKFPAEMAKRTVIRACCKKLINSSSDALLLESISRTDVEHVDAEMAAEIALEANSGAVITIQANEAPQREEQQVAIVDPPAPAEQEQSKAPF
jgi:recombination protein RecT